VYYENQLAPAYHCQSFVWNISAEVPYSIPSMK
jgi:hypothetical protein